jgi:hypothetical protein
VGTEKNGALCAVFFWVKDPGAALGEDPYFFGPYLNFTLKSPLRRFWLRTDYLVELLQNLPPF